MHPILDRLREHAQNRTQRVAVADPALALNYGALCAVAAGLSQRIAGATTLPRVGILAPTSAAGAAAIVACWWAGKTPVPLNFLLGPEERGKVMRDAGLDLVLTIEHFLPSLAPTGLKTIVLDATALTPGNAPPPDAKLDQTAVVIYTSGTSGDPKGVCLSFDNVVSNATSCIQHVRITPDQVLFSVIPQFHSFGFTAMTAVPLILGGTVWYLPRFSPATVLETIRDKQVTIFMAVASLYAALARVKSAPPDVCASLKLAVSGGEPLPAAVAAAFRERFGLDLIEGYGLTESSPVVAVNVPWDMRPGSVGRALPGVQVQAVDEQGRPLGPGLDGELVIRGHCVMQGYLNKPAETAAAIRDGALYTGDIGHVDAEGFIYITGRAKEMIIVGGENVFPREIEAALLDHPAVAEAAVIGTKDPLRGELPAAFVILREGASATETELREHCRGRLAGYKVPRFVQIEKDLPRGPTGKILKRALRASQRG